MKLRDSGALFDVGCAPCHDLVLPVMIVVTGWLQTPPWMSLPDLDHHALLKGCELSSVLSVLSLQPLSSGPGCHITLCPAPRSSCHICGALGKGTHRGSQSKDGPFSPPPALDSHLYPQEWSCSGVVESPGNLEMVAAQRSGSPGRQHRSK